MDDLAVGVDPGVGAARADELDTVAGELRYRSCQLAGHGALAWLAREPVEPGSVVGEHHPDADRVVGRSRAFDRRRVGRVRP
jgi:hypothetical protein